MNNNNGADPFEEIRPYQDDDVPAVLAGLCSNQEFIELISRYEFPRLDKWLPFFTRRIVQKQLTQRLGGIKDVAGFQIQIRDFLSKDLAKTADGVSWSGVDGLAKDKPYLFVSNHRDIALDPALVNWVCHQVGMQTARIGIGDNLLKKPYVNDLMRLNKSFIVKRSAKGVRELAAAMTVLSSYLDSSIQTGHSVWIAQREGRAKDGNDQTDPALLKMFYLSHRKQRSFAEMVERLNIVPVAISYEFDPCDRLKAKELATLARTGCYEKQPYEDLQAMAMGFTGHKGRIHVGFGTPVSGEGIEGPDQLAAIIDQQIHHNYKLFPTHLSAAGEGDLSWFKARTQGMSDDEKALMQAAYARPVINARQTG
ncbi:lysophospholipid acyltransferase family protein [Gallaecimonas mangrovi]|uniref:lysophospholipid acyltransferase family protein n=1 Tax=Gallaecimonas mangrovi TaxID=2291597 RepID=UPI000E1FD662|nr:1-acyl-sn-glycerol-3-phosphate acyltransferase [Gallaecimonas mangrovi]